MVNSSDLDKYICEFLGVNEYNCSAVYESQNDVWHYEIVNSDEMDDYSLKSVEDWLSGSSKYHPFPGDMMNYLCSVKKALPTGHYFIDTSW